MPNIIVGTAGHIDHGKTALVKALTGIDADRLKEEKERGITIDIGFANLIYQCTLSDCSAALDSTRASLETKLGAALNNVYATVKARAAEGATIIVLGYPRVFSSTGCFGTFGISSTERTKANALAYDLNGVIAAHAAAKGVAYQSATGKFIGHAVCSSSSWLNGLNLLSTGESYHPNRSGHSSGYLSLVTAISG